MSLRLLGKRGTEQLLHELRIGLSLRALHHLAYEETQHAFLAGAELRDLVGMPSQRIVDCMLESVTIADLRQSLGRDQRLEILVGPEKTRNQALRGVSIDGAGLDEAQELRQLGRREWPVADDERPVELLLTHQPEYFGRHPVGDVLGAPAGRDRGFEVVGDVLALRQDIGVVRREAEVALEAAPARAGELRHAGADVVHPGLVDREGQQVGLREVAIVVGVLLRPHRAGLLPLGVPEPGLLDQALPRDDGAGLAAELVLDGVLDVAEGVHVLDLDLGAERGRACRPHRHVGVAPEAPFLHVAVADLVILQDGAQGAEIGTGLGGAAHVGLAHDLEERNAAAVEVDQAAAAVGVVDVLPGVLLHVDAGQADASRRAVDHDLEPAGAAQWLLVHADLVALREVRVEVVLAREARVGRDLAAGGETGADGELDDAAVEHRQDAGHAEADLADVGVGWCAEGRRAAAEDLGAREQLRVHLEPDDGLEPVLRPGHGRGLRRCQSLACSYAAPMRSMVASSKAFPITCRPMGSPARSTPQGTTSPGSPARFTEMVRMSERYMVSGSSMRSPRRNAVVGATGVTSASQRAKACSKSRRMSVRTRCALR